MEMEKQLYEAAFEGNVLLLKTLLQKDPLILDRITPTFSHDTPLHVAVLRGHVEFVRELLSHNPRLVFESDSVGHTPLHVAAAKGHVDIVRELLRVEHGSGLAHSKDGMVPLHVAIMKGGRVEVVKELARGCPQSSTRSKADRGDTALHLCVRYDNLEALQLLVEMQEKDGVNLLNARNDDGNTILHMAVLHKNLEITKYLLSKPGIEHNAVNKNGLTSLDLIENSQRDIKGLEIHNFLLQSNVQRGSTSYNNNPTPPLKPQGSLNPTAKLSTTENPRQRSNPSWKRFFTFGDNPWLEEHRGTLLIIAAIIAATSALPIVNMKSNGPNLSDDYPIFAVTFVPAAVIMVLLVSGFSLRNKLCVWVVLQLMYTSIGFLGANFIGSMLSNEDRGSPDAITLVSVSILFVLLIMVSALNLVRLIVWVVTSTKACGKRRMLRANGFNDLSMA